jgi:hypothetical protein
MSSKILTVYQLIPKPMIFLEAIHILSAMEIVLSTLPSAMNLKQIAVIDIKESNRKFLNLQFKKNQPPRAIITGTHSEMMLKEPHLLETKRNSIFFKGQLMDEISILDQRGMKSDWKRRARFFTSGTVASCTYY